MVNNLMFHIVDALWPFFWTMLGKASCYEETMIAARASLTSRSWVGSGELRSKPEINEPGPGYLTARGG
ncbi:hypothetical protein JCM18918_3417 [Cutibacterium acnes JCM 18918]|nr:hypothetical protein JCM18918_3417 [Cutibacterium acnes JCM 18918]